MFLSRFINRSELSKKSKYYDRVSTVFVNKVLTARYVWSTGQQPTPATHPLHNLTPAEISAASTATKEHLSDSSSYLRFIAITRKEPLAEDSTRNAEVIVLNSKSGLASELTIALQADGAKVTEQVDLSRGTQPMLRPEDCDLAEEIMKSSPEVQQALQDRYGITDMEKVAGDPWSVHLASEDDYALTEPDDPSLPPRRLVQTFLYQRVQGKDLEDNHYAHPIDLVPIVDLNTKTVVRIDGLEREPAPNIPQLSANYHRNLVKTNSYLPKQWRADLPKRLDITQSEGPSFRVTDSNMVQWQNWEFRVGFHYREGLIIEDVTFDGRSVLKRGALVEMSVPYGDPHPPYTRKCKFGCMVKLQKQHSFSGFGLFIELKTLPYWLIYLGALDVGDYGLGYCTNSLELGCDCLGHIHYFDAYLNDVDGNPTLKKKAICMHEEDTGVLWKHVEYRNGHSETRRARELVISSVYTVVNYEYLFYIRFKMDGSIDFEMKLTGELSTNLTSVGEDPENPTHGLIVAPGVNSQIHQHMFSARLDMAVGSEKNSISEVDVLPEPICEKKNPYGNAFSPVETVLQTEQEAIRVHDESKARCWKIFNAEGLLNPISKKPVAYKLLPHTKGMSMPNLLTHPEVSTVSTKSAFATKSLWVTPYHPKERYPAGEYPTQAKEPDGLPIWTKSNRNVEGERIVLWHTFGVTHFPRVEDFPVMPVEMTGFTLKPDGFSSGNPAIDLPPEVNDKSKLAGDCCN